LQSYQTLGDYRGEIEDYNKAMEINPKYADAYNNRGFAKGNLNDYSWEIDSGNVCIKIRKRANTFECVFRESKKAR